MNLQLDMHLTMQHGRTDVRTDVEVGRGSILTLGRTRRGASGIRDVSAGLSSAAASRADERDTQ